MRHREPSSSLDDVTLVVLHNQHEGSGFAERKANAPGGYGSFPCVHAANGFPFSSISSTWASSPNSPRSWAASIAKSIASPSVLYGPYSSPSNLMNQTSS